MFSQLVFLTLVLLIGSTAVSGQNRTTTTPAPIISCQEQSRCPSTHFCNLRQRVCVLKFGPNSTCADDVECASNKCVDKICRRTCDSDDNCPSSKEYCTTFTKFCQEKHCGLCTRNAQCANHRCGFLHCVSSGCTAALIDLQKKP